MTLEVGKVWLATDVVPRRMLLSIVERLEAITAKTIIHHLQQSRLGKTDFVYSIPSTLT